MLPLHGAPFIPGIVDYQHDTSQDPASLCTMPRTFNTEDSITRDIAYFQRKTIEISREENDDASTYSHVTALTLCGRLHFADGTVQMVLHLYRFHLFDEFLPKFIYLFELIVNFYHTNEKLLLELFYYRNYVYLNYLSRNKLTESFTAPPQPVKT